MWNRSQIFFNLALLRYFLYGKMYQREFFFLSGNITIFMSIKIPIAADCIAKITDRSSVANLQTFVF